MPHDRYKTVRELADRLEIAEPTVRRWIKTGELRAIAGASRMPPRALPESPREVTARMDGIVASTPEDDEG
jgi:predicted site-specific integrase-resolvase